MSTLKTRISGAEETANVEESPIAALFNREKRAAAAAGPPGASLTPTGDDSGSGNRPEGAPSPSQRLQSGVQVGASEFRDIPAVLMEEMEQPFRISDDYIHELEESITERGVIQRIIVRPHPSKPGMYQIIDGRHRRRAAMRLGYTLLPCEIRQLDDDDALLLVIETTLRLRPPLLHSEKAKAYKIRLEALSHQGKRTSDQSGQKWSVEEVADDSEDSKTQVQRYIRLTYLIPELLDAVDAKTLGFGVGVTLSYLSVENQEAVHKYFFIANKITITGDVADTLRASDEKGVTFTAERLKMILAPAVPAKRFNKVSVPMKQLRSYFPAEATAKQVEKQIIEIVKKYFEEGGQ